MGKVIITRTVKATVMTLGDYNSKRGWTIPANEDPLTEGYFIEDSDDGGVTWVTKEFYNKYAQEVVEGIVPSKSFKIEQHDRLRQEIGSIGDAESALDEGKLVYRSGWNGKGMFIAKQIPAVIGTDIIPKMQSLPQSAKDVLIDRDQSISYENQMLIVNANGKANSWVPSSSDFFAKDWGVYELSVKEE